MANIIDDETIEYVGILAKLELSGEEKEQAKADMGRMLDYIDKLNELDTEGVEPMSHLFPVTNVFREDEVTNTDNRDKILKNAPGEKKGCSKYRVRGIARRNGGALIKEGLHRRSGKRGRHEPVGMYGPGAGR